MFTQAELLRSAKESRGWKLIGYAVSNIIFGILIFQIYLYFMIYRSDPKWLQLYILAVGGLETLGLAFHAWYMYDVLIVHFQDFDFVLENGWLLSTEPILIGIITGSIQLFVGWKIRNFDPRIRWLCFPVIGCAIAGIVSAILVTSGAWPSSRTPKVTVVLWLGMETLSDIFITSALLLKMKHALRSLDASKTTVLQLLFRYVVQTGLLATVCVTLSLISYTASPIGLGKVIILPLSKVHAISLMSTLNSRTEVVYLSLSSQGSVDAAENSDSTRNQRLFSQSKPLAQGDTDVVNSLRNHRRMSERLHITHRHHVTDEQHPTRVFVESGIETDSLVAVRAHYDTR